MCQGRLLPGSRGVIVCWLTQLTSILVSQDSLLPQTPDPDKGLKVLSNSHPVCSPPAQAVLPDV